MAKLLNPFTHAILIGFLTCVLTGCGGNPVTNPQAGVSVENDRLLMVHQAFTMFYDENKKYPSSLQDILRYEAGLDLAILAIREGKIIVRWGTPLTEPHKVLAYEKEVPSGHGLALLTNGTIVRMTKEELASK